MSKSRRRDRKPQRERAETPPTRHPIDALLLDLGAQLRRGDQTLEPPAPCPTGIPALDALLGGGLPGGGLSEVSGPLSSGRSAFSLALLAATTMRGELAALIDVADAFDPLSAEAAGVDLDRVLWARAPEPGDALRCASRLLETEGFPLVLLDLRAMETATSGSFPAGSSWLRLSRLASATRTALVLLSAERLAGTYADAAFVMHFARPYFSGTPPLLEALEIQAELVRHRSAPLGAAPLRVSLRGVGSAASYDSTRTTQGARPAPARKRGPRSSAA